MTTQEILKKIIDEHGGFVLFAKENKSRLSGMIGDYFPHDSKMRKMLRIAVNENVACRLLKVKDSDDAHLEIKKLKFYLHEECGLDESIVSQVVDCFAFALGLESAGSHSQTSKSDIESKQDRTIRKDAASEQVFDSGTSENSANMISITNETKITLRPYEPEMVFVQGGTFDREKPIHKVTVSDFYIGKYEVTQAQWKAVMGNNPSYFKGEELPVECVSWDDVQVFIRMLNALTGKLYRLPTESEWEFAARGGNKSKGCKYSGSKNLENVAWYEKNSNKQTHPVGTKSPNELDIYDMSGNVWEWCSDWFGEYSSKTETNPHGPISGSSRVFRGGSWCSNAFSSRVSFRFGNYPGSSYNALGFRLACSSSHPVEPEMVFVQGGTFMMGATPEQGNDCFYNEKPAYKVTISDFFICKYVVTQDQWKAVMDNNPSHFKGEKLPVEQVSWDDVQVFIRKLNLLTGKEYRLPTEAEWEFAARGGNKSKGYKYSGSNNVGNVAWYYDNSNQTHPVGTKSPNELGIYDMSGNVWEWCSDWYGDYSSNAQTNPQGPKSGSQRVNRGGSWCYFARYARVSVHSGNQPDARINILGFRLACSSK